MKNDETNFRPDVQTWIEPEVEARVIAWVLGEASPFEIAQLEKLVAEKPELAIFKRRMETVHGLVAEAAKPDATPLQLSAARREKLLQTLATAGEQPVAPVAVHEAKSLARPARRRWTRQIYLNIAGAAAACVLGVFIYQREGAFTNPSRPDPSQTVLGEAGRVLEDKRESGMSDRRVDVWDQRGAAFRAGETEALSQLEPPPALATVLPSAELAPFESRRRASASSLPSAPPAGLSLSSINDLAPSNRSTAGRDDSIRAQAKSESFALSPGAKPAAPSRQEGNADAFGDQPLGITTSNDQRAGQQLVRGGASGTALAQAAPQEQRFVVQDVALAKAPAAATPAPADAKRAGFAGGGGGGAGTDLAQDKAKLAEAGAVVLGAADASSAPAPAVLGITGSAGLRETKTDADKPLVRPTAPLPPVNESAAAQEPLSTFSLHVSDVSFRLAQAALARGELPDPARIRPEEFYNAFDYGDPAPGAAEKVAARIEQAAHPFLQQRNLVRVAVKVPATGRGAGQPLRLTVLVDTSGSMEREDRVAIVQRAMAALTGLLGPNDRFTLIGFARQPRLLAEAVPGNQAAAALAQLARTPAEGGTNLEEALKLGGELARRHRLAGAQNRIVVLTDGAANLGDADPERLASAVETLRQQGIAFDACGVGLDGLDDAVLEALTRKGDGRYYVLNSPEGAGANFATKLAGAFRPAAENVKLQVRFNPARVGNYRLIGFEQHRLRPEDFRNDAVDAAELAAEEAAVALYQVEVLPQGEGELGEVFVRFRDPASGGAVERSWTITHDPAAQAFDRATPTLQLAGTAALLAEKLRGGPAAEAIRLRELAPAMEAVRNRHRSDARVQELAAMFAQARRLLRD